MPAEFAHKKKKSIWKREISSNCKCFIDDCLQVSGNTTSDNPEIIRAKELEAMRSRKQSELEAQYKEALAKHRDRIRDKDGAAIRETFLSQIRRWYTEQHESNGKFPDLPAEEEGGSKIIYSKPDRPAEIPVPVVVKKVGVLRIQ